jgi:hypothetical protein
MILAHIIGKKFIGEGKLPDGRPAPSDGFTEA